MNKTRINAEIVAHSLSPQGDELISVLCTFPRIILAEVNTHRMLSKNTSSSRAIPFKKMVEAVQSNPFIPIAWQKEHKGMQGSEYITNLDDIGDADAVWLMAREEAIDKARLLNQYEGVTKQLCNRLLEPFMWTTMLITGSKEGWNNFFNLRCPKYSNAHFLETIYESEHALDTYYNSKKDLIRDLRLSGFNTTPIEKLSDIQWLEGNKGQAEIHIMDLAEKIYDAMNESTPEQLKARGWHIPFAAEITDLYIKNKGYVPEAEIPIDEFVKISTAMAAHTSYTVVGGEAVKSYEKWIDLHDKLIAYDPPHSSPMEHCARAMSDGEYFLFNKGKGVGIHELGISYSNPVVNFHKKDKGWCNNLKGFIPYRYFIDNKIEL